MNTSSIQPLLRKAAKKSFLIRALAFTLVIVFAVLIGYIAGRISPRECSKSVLGSQWPTFPSPTPTPTSHWPTFPSPTPTPTSHWPTFPSPTPTPTSHWPTFPSPTPTPTSHWPTPTPTNTPLTPNKIKQIVSDVGITLSTGITMNTGTHSYTVKGNMQDRILGLIQISDPVTLSVNGNGGIRASIAKPWWQKIFTNPFINVIKCSSITTGETECLKDGCSYWSDCGKCEDPTTPYDLACSCDTIKSKSTCNASASCNWHSECAGGGACAVAGTSSQVACGGCQNIIGDNACDDTPGCTIDPRCGRCETVGVSDP
ncbi:MAG: hypothetical protein ABSE17_04255, partial [Candidatus Levyibacteriota bacterium]